jgi:hypothetical protein
MSRKSPTISPVDRAVGELEQRLADVERQARQLESDTTAQFNPPPPRPEAALVNWLRDIFTPPGRRPPPAPIRRDLFDLSVNNPMPHLDTQSTAVVRPDADLFQKGEHGRLAHYLGAGSVKTFKPLKHVQRRQRQQFYIWLGLAFLVVLFLWLVMH